MRLDGERIIVTGGASGIGAGLVEALPALGAAVVSVDIDETAGRSVAAGAGVRFVPCDVADSASVTTAFSQAVAHLGGLDVLIHAAGLAPTATAEETEPDLWDRVMDINARGTYLTNREALTHLREHGGRVVNFASSAGMNGYRGKAAYAASKGAVLAWTRTCADEWGQFRISVNAVCPMMNTPMYQRTRSLMSVEQLAQHDALMARTIPMGGVLGDVGRDLVPVVAFLASKESAFMTGQTLVVDGGRAKTR